MKVKQIAGYEGRYGVTKSGRVYSYNRKETRNCHRTGVWLRAGKMTSGYLYVNLSDSVGQRKNRSIHRLVAQTFIPNPDNLPQVNHINGIKTDNRVENLEWVSALDNAYKRKDKPRSKALPRGISKLKKSRGYVVYKSYGPLRLRRYVRTKTLALNVLREFISNIGVYANG